MEYKIIELNEVPEYLNHRIAWNAQHYDSGQSEYAAILEDGLHLGILNQETGGDWRYQGNADIDRLMAQIKDQEQ